MAVEIKDLSEDKVLVNDKLVYTDTDGNWVAKIELTQTEAKALSHHLSSRKN